MEKDYRLALLPADTRIPDHSIWTHMQVVSALAGCVGGDKVWQPAFLNFSFGPVQEFIARRPEYPGPMERQLPALVAHGRRVEGAFRRSRSRRRHLPESTDQPLFDLHWRDELWSKVNIGTQTSGIVGPRARRGESTQYQPQPAAHAQPAQRVPRRRPGGSSRKLWGAKSPKPSQRNGESGGRAGQKILTRLSLKLS